MRIIAGEYASRKIEAPKGNATRPTLDKVREAVFSSLGTYFDGGTFLDLYAGSGANGFEALSRGMDFAYFVDVSSQAIQCIKQNIQTLQCDSYTQVLKKSDITALEYFIEHNIRFDLIYLDPPYQKQKNEKILSIIDSNHLLNENGVIVIESLKDETYQFHFSSLEYTKEKIYGISKITYYKHKQMG